MYDTGPVDIPKKVQNRNGLCGSFFYGWQQDKTAKIFYIFMGYK
jgi:hypothetical protein